MRLPRGGSILATVAMLLMVAPAARAQDRIALEVQEDVWTVEADGSVPQNLTDSLAREQNPTWSPDGERIAFTSVGHAYVMNANGSDTRMLIDTPDRVVGIDWARDGRIAYIVQDRETLVRTLMIADRFGANPQTVATGLAD